MNIFPLDKDLSLSAKYMVDKHVIKMPVESAQMLCTALHCCGQDAPYKSTHIDHPDNVWCRYSYENWMYLKELALNICSEYTYRYGKIHKAEIVIRSLPLPNLPHLGLTKLPCCMDKQFIRGDDVVANYRRYYSIGKKHIHSWKNREIPNWINTEEA